MLEVAKKADVVTISHYHFDHHTPAYTDWASHWASAETAEQIYGGKLILAKSYRSRINPSQRRRGWMFARTGGELASKLEFADGGTFQFGATTIRFPEPVYHGRKHSELGWVLMAVIERGDEKVLFAPDVQGPLYEKSLKMILAEDPRLAIVGGPPVYLVDFRETRGTIDSAMRNLESIVERVPVTILDHHVLRGEKWRETARPVLEKASSVGHRLVTAAEYAGEENRLLESKRKQLYESEPPSREFIEWTKIPIQERKRIRPPI